MIPHFMENPQHLGDGGALLAQFKTSFFDMAINPNALSNELVTR